MRISTFFYTFKQGIVNIFRNKWFSLASLATIGSCLFLFGLFYTIVMNVNHIVRNVEEGVSVTVFFEEGTTDEELVQIGEQIRAREEVAEAVFISDDQAWEEWSAENLNEYKDTFAENPFEGLDSYEIYMTDVELQPQLVSWLESQPSVRLVNYSDVAATTLTGVNALLFYASVGIITILLLVSIFLINNTVVIGISVRSKEINVMRYIGATDYFVRAPFVIEGILIGIIGSLIPVGIIYYFYNEVIRFVASEYPAVTGIFQFLPAGELLETLLPVSLGIGVGIGFLGSFFTVRKHLKV